MAVTTTGCGEQAVAVSTVAVEPATVVRTVAAPATVDAAARVEVRAPVAGVVAELPVTDGAQVGLGDTLVVLASDSLTLQFDQAKAALDAADALAGAAGVLTGDLSPLLGAFRAQLDTSFPALLAALDAQLLLIENAAVFDADGRQAAAEAREQIGELEAEFEQTRRELAQAEDDARRQAAQASRFQRAAAEAQRLQAQLALEAIQARVDQLTIAAPLRGLVAFTDRQAPAGQPDPLAFGDVADLGGFDVGGLLNGSFDSPVAVGLPLAVGEAVRSGETLMTIYDLSAFLVRLEVDELDIVEVEIGQPVRVTVDALPAAELTGSVVAIATAPQRRGQLGATFAVTVALDEVAQVPLRIGLTAIAEIEVQRETLELTVPTAALLRRGDTDVVRVLADGVVRDRVVKVVVLGDERAAITGQIAPGDRVIVDGLADVADGSTAVEGTAPR